MKLNLFKFLNSEISRNVTVLISGTAVAQLIPILLQPVLRRSFTPEMFGAYSVYLSIIGILIVISSMRYELAIVLPDVDEEASAVFFLSVLLNFAFNSVLLIVIVILKPKILELLNLSAKFAVYLYFVPLGTFLFSFYQSINYWLIRKKGFIEISVNKLVRRGFEGGAQLLLSFTKMVSGLLAGDLIGHIANISAGIVQGRKKGLSLGVFNITKIKEVSIKYAEYPKFNFLPALMETCSFLLPAILINRFFSSENTGYYDLTRLVLSVPLALIATSFSNVLLQRVAEKDRTRKSVRDDLVMVLIIVSAIIVLEIAVILPFGNWLFSFVFGSGWELSGKISGILIWSFAFNFLTSSFSSVFVSLKKIRIWSIWQVFYFSAIMFLFFFRHLDFISFIKVYVLIDVFCSLVVSILIIRIISDYEKKLMANATN